MPDDSKHIPLRIDRMPDGGFVVAEAPTMYGGDPHRFTAVLFASTSIGEALEFIARRLDPKPVEAVNTAATAFEVGKSYRTRNGMLATIEFDGHEGRYPIRGHVGKDRHAWTEAGDWNCLGGDFPLDLIHGVSS